MQVSSVDQSYLLNLYANSINKTANSTDTTSQTAAATDTAAISNEAQRMPPPPHEMDFENMSDGDLKDYLQQMYDLTGTLPGGADGTVDSLSEEDLAQIRETLIEMSQSSPVSQMMASEDTSGLSGDDFKTLLTMFMINMQSSLASIGDDSSSSGSDLLFSGGDTEIMMQTIMDQMLSKLTASEEDENAAQTQTQQALNAYEQNMTII